MDFINILNLILILNSIFFLEPVVEMKNHSFDVTIGEKVSISCATLHSSWFQVFEVFWEKIETDDEENPSTIDINEKTKKKYEMFNKKHPHLTIKNAEESDDAFYCCCVKYSSLSGDLFVIKSEKARLYVNEGKIFFFYLK